MNNLIKTIGVLVLILGVPLLYTQQIHAACGTYFSALSTCVDAETNNEVTPYAVCSQNAAICCNNQEQCDDIFGTAEDPPPEEEPPPTTYPPSDQMCGAWHNDPGLGRQVCLDGSGNEVVSALSCGRAPECCRGEDSCTVYYSCLLDPDGNKTGACKIDYSPGTTIDDPDTCLAECAIEENPENPDITPIAPFFDINSLLCADKKSLHTAIGCIPIEDSSLFSFFLRWGIVFASGIAFVLIIIASIIITTSTGDPKRLQAGKELLSSSLIGLILMIFTIFILRLVGVNILGISIF